MFSHSTEVKRDYTGTVYGVEMGTAAYDKAAEFINARMTGNGARILHWWQDDYWLWKHPAYTQVSRTELRRLLMSWLQTTTSGEVDSRFRDEVFEHVDAMLFTQSPRGMPVWLPIPRNEQEHRHEWLLFQNGILDVTRLIEGEGMTEVPLEPTTPRWFARTWFPVPWEPAATCPLWVRVLDQWMCGDEAMVAFLQEFVGYCLTTDMRHGIGLFLEGEGANGKTTFADVVTALVGQHNCSSVPLQDWSLPFSLADTYGKLINFSPETDARREIPAALLKGYITGDLYTFKRKYKEGVTARPTAKLIITWNRRPRVNDDSDGFWRRIRLVPWRAVFDVQRRDEYLLDKLKEELPGIMRWAVEGLVRLRRVGKFTLPSQVLNAADSYREESDTARAFCGLALKEAPGSCVPKLLVFRAYTDWCEDRGYLPVKLPGFLKALYRRFPTVRSGRRRIDGDRETVLENLMLTQEGRALIPL